MDGERGMSLDKDVRGEPGGLDPMSEANDEDRSLRDDGMKTAFIRDVNDGIMKCCRLEETVNKPIEKLEDISQSISIALTSGSGKLNLGCALSIVPHLYSVQDPNSKWART